MDHDDIDDPRKAYTDLGRQAKSAFKRHQSFDTLIFNLNDGTLSRCTDVRPEYYNNQALGRAFLVKEVLDLDWTVLHTWLSEHDRAEKIGFNPEKFADGKQAPHRTTLSRAWNNRFAELQDYIQNQAKWLKEIAENTEHQHPLGPPLQTGEEHSNPPQLTEQQALRSTAKDVLDELETLVFPLLSLDRPENPVYSEKELLTLEALLGMTNNAANGGGRRLGDILNPDPDPDDPFTADGPTGETLLESIKPLDVEEIWEMFNDALAKLFTRAKVEDGFTEPVDIAIDVTYVGYYADPDEIVWVHGSPGDKEYDWCFLFATAAVVGENTHFTLAMMPLGHPDYRDDDAYAKDGRHYRTGEIFRKLLNIVKQRDLRIRTVLADREFCSTDVIAACEKHSVPYIIPARRDDRVKRVLRRHVSGVTVKEDYPMHGPIKHGPQNQRVETNLVVLPEKHADKPGPAPFLTNLDVREDDHGSWVIERIERYGSRGAIETSYKKIKEFAAWTTSKAFEVRLYHFGMAAVLYNTWLLVDVLVQTRMDVEFRVKPRLSASRFLGFLDERLDKLIQG